MPLEYWPLGAIPQVLAEAGCLLKKILASGKNTPVFCSSPKPLFIESQPFERQFLLLLFLKVTIPALKKQLVVFNMDVNQVKSTRNRTSMFNNNTPTMLKMIARVDCSTNRKRDRSPHSGQPFAYR